MGKRLDLGAGAGPGTIDDELPRLRVVGDPRLLAAVGGTGQGQPDRSGGRERGDDVQGVPLRVQDSLVAAELDVGKLHPLPPDALQLRHGRHDERPVLQAQRAGDQLHAGPAGGLLRGHAAPFPQPGPEQAPALAVYHRQGGVEIAVVEDA